VSTLLLLLLLLLLMLLLLLLLLLLLRPTSCFQFNLSKTTEFVLLLLLLAASRLTGRTGGHWYEPAFPVKSGLEQWAIATHGR
jgi:hypothetical protein